ncbi:MAG: creatininase family protein [Planctomycetota bacterium]
MLPQPPHETDLTRLTTVDIAALDGDATLIVLPIGAIEQHGPHLPVYTDAAQIMEVLRRALETRPQDGRVWTLPLLPYGKSNEHTGFPGTLTLSAGTLTAVLTDLGRSAYASGLRRLLLLNGHGGQPEVIDTAARDLRVEFPDLLVFTAHPFRFSCASQHVTADEKGVGIHANEAETSMVLAIQPDDVRPERYASQLPSTPQNQKHLRLKGGASFAWLTRDLSPTGTLGDPRSATPEKGHAILDGDAATLNEIIDECLNFTFAPAAANGHGQNTRIPASHSPHPERITNE